MRTVGDKYGITPAQVALAWAIGKGTTPIIGVTKPAQVQDALEAIKVTLTDDEMKVLEETAENTGVDTRLPYERCLGNADDLTPNAELYETENIYRHSCQFCHGDYIRYGSLCFIP